MSSRSATQSVGAVVIGRNEGRHLALSLPAARAQCSPIVYVDSGSTDDSENIARTLGIAVLKVDTTRPLSAARARNEGLAFLRNRHKDLTFIQFIDGDCELAVGWIKQALKAMKDHPETAIVCGHLRERRPDASIYNRLCDLEWRASVGVVAACGGIFLVRVDAFLDVGGFDVALFAGEEPELCLRLRRTGATIRHIDHDMAVHDAELTRFAQWWQRSVRSGYATAAGFHRHGRGAERYKARALRSILVWAFALPLLVLIGLTHTPWAALLLITYPVQAVRIGARTSAEGVPSKHAWLYAVFTMLGKFAEGLGVFSYAWSWFRGRLSP